MERKVFGNSFGNSQVLEILHLSVNLEIQELFCSIWHFQSLLLAHKHSNAASVHEISLVKVAYYSNSISRFFFPNYALKYARFWTSFSFFLKYIFKKRNTKHLKIIHMMLINMCLFDHESNTCSVTSQLTITHPFSYLWERKLWPICTSGFCSPFNDERRTVAINLFIQHIAKLNKKLNLKMINLRDQTSHDSISLVMFPSSKLQFCWSCKLVVLLL